MKRLQLLLSLLTVVIASMANGMAQAPKHGYADPSSYTHRLQKVIFNDSNHEYRYFYNEAGFTTKRQEFDAEGNGLGRIEYLYDDNGYLKQVDEYRRQSESTGEFFVSKRVTYQRDQQGYITNYERSTLWKNTSQDDEDLTPDWRLTVEYNDQHQATKGYITFVNQQTGKFGEATVVSTLQYDADGRYIGMIKESNTGVLYQTRTATYNDNGMIASYSKTEADTNEEVFWTLTYDEHNNAIKSGRPGFMFKYEYNETLDVNKVFLPRAHTIADLMIFGYENCMFMDKLPYEHASVNPVSFDKMANREFIYEANNGATHIEQVNDQQQFNVHATPKQIELTCSAELIGATLSIYSIDGNLRLTQTVNQSRLTINNHSLNKGLYIIKVGNQIRKIII